MLRSLATSLLATLAAGILGLGCKPSSDSAVACTPFPAPSTASSPACIPFAKATLLHDLGYSEPCSGYGSGCMTVDETAIYFTAGSPAAATPALFRLPKTGGTPQALDQGVAGPVVVAAPASLLYTRITSHPSGGGTAFDYPNVARLDDTCAAEELPNAGYATVAGGPVADATGAINWLASSSPNAAAVLHWDPTTQATTQIASETGFASLVGDADHVYWIDAPAGATASEIMAMPSAGGTPSVLATMTGAFQITDVDDTSLYVLSTAGGADWTLSSVSKANGSATTIAVNLYDAEYNWNENWIGGVASGGSVYWVDKSQLLRASANGGPAEVVFDLSDPSSDPLHQSEITSMAVDSCNVYYSVAAAGGYSIWGQALTPAVDSDASAQ